MKTSFHGLICFLFALVLSLYLLEKNFYNLLGEQDDYLKANIYLKNSTLESEINQLRKIILAADENSSFTVINKEKALSDFSSTFAEYSRHLIDLDDVKDIIPFIIEIKFTSEQIKNETIKKIKNHELVDEITQPTEAYKNFYSINTITKSLLWTLFVVSFLVCLVMTMLLIRNVIYEDQEKINILTMFGKSFDGLVYEYLVQFGKYFFITVTVSIAGVYFVFYFSQAKLMSYQELYYIGSRLRFLTLPQIFNLTIGFAVSYFTALYLVLQKSISKSFRNL